MAFLWSLPLVLLPLIIALADNTSGLFDIPPSLRIPIAPAKLETSVFLVAVALSLLNFLFSTRLQAVLVEAFKRPKYLHADRFDASQQRQSHILQTRPTWPIQPRARIRKRAHG